MSRVLWDMVEGPMPRGLLGVGAGDLQCDGDRWTLFLGGYTTSFRNTILSATAPATSDLFTAVWTVRTDRRGRAAPLVPHPPRAAWDGGGLHTPSALPAAAGVPARIYYAGRGGRRHVGSGSTYSIGVLEHRDGRWVRRGAPVLTGGGARRSVLEPRVVRDGDRYVMWFLATPHEVARGEQPDYELRTTTSADGVSGWTTPTTFATATEGFFDVALTPSADGWAMVLARGTNLHGTVPYPEQGLWLMRAAEPSPDRSRWSPPVRLLDTDAAGIPDWMGRGVCDPAAATADDGTLTVLVSGTRRHPGWPRLVARRLRRGARPPVPAPFYLSTVALRFDADEVRRAGDPDRGR